MNLERLKKDKSNQLLVSLVTKDEIREMFDECIRDALELYLNTPKAPPSGGLISRKDAASILGISLPTLSTWTKQGIVPAYRIGASVRYKRNEVEDSLKKIKSINSKN